MSFFRKPIRPAFVILALCLLVAVWKTTQIASMEREVALALAELQPSQPALTISQFSREYLADPFGKAMGLSHRQLQLCQQLSARVPAYEAAGAWRNDAVFIAFVTLLYVLFQRYRARLPIDRWRAAGRGWFQRLALRMAPLIAEARRRAEEKRRGRASANGASSTAGSGTVYDIVACPTCGQKLRLPTGKGSLRVKCSGCRNIFECRT